MQSLHILQKGMNWSVSRQHTGSSACPLSSSSVLMDKFGSWMASSASAVRAHEGSLCLYNVVLGKDSSLNAGGRQWL